MRYKIKSSLIEPSWFEETIFETLKMYDNGELVTDSPLANFLRNYETWGGLHRDLVGKDLEAGISERLADLIILYKSIKKKGWFGPDMFVYFDEDGFIRLYDGHHRLSILRYLKMDPMVWVTTDWDSKGIDPTGIKGEDFPLVEVAKSIFGREEMYQRIPDERLKHFVAQRPDSEQRLKYLLANVVGNSVLDIGCSEGFFCHELTKKGYGVTGIEAGYKGDEGRGRKLLAITRYLATIQNLKMRCILGDWKDLIRNHNVKFDNILYLSVLHNEINALGKKKAFENLELFRGKAQRLFVEIPDIVVQKDWTHYFKDKEFRPMLERATKMKIKEVWHGYRPIILLENKLKNKK